MALPPTLREAFARQRARGRRDAWVRLGAWLVLLISTVAALGVAAQAYLAVEEPVASPAAVPAPDADGDGVPDVLENARGTDPFSTRAAALLPEAWVIEHGLDLSDPELPNRTAAYPRPPDTPAVYGPAGLPEELRMTLREVYEHGRPAEWDEARDGAWDSGLDPRAWDVNGSGVPYSWMIRHGYDPHRLDALDEPDPSGTVPWTPREAYERGLHPRLRDGDADGLDDELELSLGSNPRRFSTSGAGIADGWLHAHGFSLEDPAIAFSDVDADGLTQLEEFNASRALVGDDALAGGGLDPRRLSTRGGPIPDGWLVRYGLDALDAGVFELVTEERAVEGAAPQRLTVLDEYLVNRPPLWNESANGPWWGGSDPSSNDTDEDGIADLEEIVGYDIRRSGQTRRVASDPTRADTDGDGLTDAQEREGRAGDITFTPTDPSSPDSDFDGLLDGEEVGLRAWRGLTLPRLDPNEEDTDADGLADGAEAEYWLSRAERYEAQPSYEWGPEPRPDASAALGAAGSLAALLLPGADADGDGEANALDPDSDGDGLLDGWEAMPTLYRSTRFAAEQPRSATDPANPDTDLDGLPDAWEVEHGEWDAKVGGWNLDPSRWSSFFDDTSDADRDLDDDGITWYTYERRGDGIRRTAHEFVATNRLEFEAGSDPNARSSSPDGLSDGWKIFWGTRYPTLPRDSMGDVYPGAPGEPDVPQLRFQIGREDREVLAEREVRQPVLLGAGASASCSSVLHVSLASGEERDVCVLVHAIVHDLAAVEANGTNPYLSDTDGDGVDDAWESAWSWLATGSRKVDPTVPDAREDLDGDGLDADREARAGGNPYEPDTDFGGASDGLEAALGLDLADPRDDGNALDSATDTDGDGIPDVEEVGGVLLADGRRVALDPRDPDTDRDGLLDGLSLSQVLGRTLRVEDEDDSFELLAMILRGLAVVEADDGGFDVPGELTVGSDPTRFDTAGDGVPDGYAFSYWRTPTESTGAYAQYSYGRPEWWDEKQHGIWRWGLPPGGTPTRDHDGDGLDDLNGEDPIPFANPLNELIEGHPQDPGITSWERLARAQLYGGMPPPEGAPLPRVETNLTLDPLPANVTDGTRFAGNLTTARGEPVPNATVVLSLGDRAVVVGAAITNQTGGFEGEVRLARAIPAPPGSGGIPVFGAADGTGEHLNADSGLAVSANDTQSMFAWSYNVSHWPPPRQARNYTLTDDLATPGVLGNASAPQAVNVTLATAIRIDAPPHERVGATVELRIRLEDALGRGVAGRNVTLNATGSPNVTLATDADGLATRNVTLSLNATAHAYRADFAGERGLLASNATASVRALAQTTLDLSPPPVDVRPNETFLLTARLTSGATPVHNATVTLRGPDGVVTAATNVHGHADFRLVAPFDAALGTREYVAEYAGNETLDAARANATVRVRGVPRWEADPVRATLPTDVEVTARLVELTGEPVARAPVTMTGPGGARNGTTDADGRVRWTIPAAFATPGERVHVLRYDDPVRGAATLAVPVVLSSPTTATLRLADDLLVRGRPAALEGALVDVHGDGLPRQPLSVRIGPLSLLALTRDDGTFRVDLPDTAPLSAGDVVAAVQYAGSPDGIYLPAAASATVPVRDAAVLDLASRDLLAQRPVLAGRLRTEVGEPLSGRDLSVDLGHGPASVVTGADGGFRLLLAIPPEQPLGRLTALVALPEEPRLLGLDAVETLLLKDQGTLTLRPPASVLRGAGLEVPYEVRDSRGRLVGALTLEVEVDGAPAAAATSPGVLRVSLPHDAALGDHRVRVHVRSDVVAASPVTFQVDLRQPTRLVLEERPSIVAGSSGEAVVRLESGGVPLPNRTLHVEAGAVSFRLTTDEQGRAVVPISAVGASTTTLGIAFAGEDGDAASTLALRVDPHGAARAPAPAWWPWLALPLLLLAVAAAWLWRRSRARRVQGVLQRASRRLRSGRADLRALYDVYVSLLALAGLPEDEADTMTFGVLLSRFLEKDAAAATDLELLTALFDEAVYAPGAVEPGRLAGAADALQRLAERAHDPAPAA